MELQLIVPNKKTKEKIEVSNEIFAKDFNEPLVHQVVTAYLAGARFGNAAQKTRAEVRGGGKKPWRQKGTGRARAGTIRSPLWRGGGIIFAAKKRDYSQKMNRKMYRGAIASIFSELVRQNRLQAVNELTISEPKSKKLLALFKEIEIKNNKVLIIVDEINRNLYLAAQNLPDVTVIDVESMDPVNLVRHDLIIVTEKALRKIEERLA